MVNKNLVIRRRLPLAPEKCRVKKSVNRCKVAHSTGHQFSENHDASNDDCKLQSATQSRQLDLAQIMNGIIICNNQSHKMTLHSNNTKLSSSEM